MTYTVYTLPGTDAGVAIATKGTAATLALLAKGRSRLANGGGYKLRNPERRVLFLHLRARLVRVRVLRATKGGKADTPVQAHGIPTEHASLDDAAAALRRAYTAAGNYRLDVAVTLHGPLSSDELAAALGLVPRTGSRPPQDVRWLR